MDLNGLRLGQHQAIRTICERVGAGEQKTGIILPTRYGKSDVIRLVSHILKAEGRIAGSIAFSPNLYLRNQLVRQDQLEKMCRRYRMDEAISQRYRTMRDAFEHGPYSNDEILLSTTIQLATRQSDMFVEIVSSQAAPILIHIDECHETSAIKRRGELVQCLVAAGALIVLYTATAIRADGEMIPGFRTNELSRTDEKRYVTTDAGDGRRNRIDVFNDEKHLVELIADHTTTFHEAWNEKPSPLCKLSRHIIDVQLSELSSEAEENIALAECSPTQARRYLTKAVSHPIVIQKTVEEFVRQLSMRKCINPDAAGIIFTCSDIDRSSNQHAKEIRAELEHLEPAWDCHIVTMKSDEGDDSSSRLLARFVGTDEKPGIGDVLLVKNMGGAGLDAPRIKVMADLSPTRTVSSVVQRMMRAATPWGSMRTAEVIMLADPMNAAIWKRCIEDEDGVMRFNITAESEWIDFYFKDKPDPGPELLIEIQAAMVLGFDDTLGNQGDIANLDFVNEILRRAPELLNYMTSAEVENRFRDFTLRPEVSTRPRRDTLDDRIQSKQALIVGRAKDLAGPYNPHCANEFVERFKAVINQAKTAAGVPLNVNLKDVVNLRTLDVMLNVLAPK